MLEKNRMIPADHIRITDYTYHLPDERIAKYPLPERDQSKLLIYKRGQITEDVFIRLPDYLSEGDMLVFNNTRVIRARIEMEKSTGARIEIFCLEPHDPSDYQLSFSQQQTCVWRCMVGNLKKWKSGILIKNIEYQGCLISLQAERLSGSDYDQVIRFTWNGGVDFGTLLDVCGYTPIPPYLNRKTEDIDELRYQTIYAKNKGSVAAPTAGLHFTPRVMEQVVQKGIMSEEITLHVGAGTFRPVQQDEVNLHKMHVEFFSVHVDLVKDILANKGTITSVGTTSLRALESLYWIGVKMLFTNKLSFELLQWEIYTLPQNISLFDALSKILQVMNDSGQKILWASTQMMIVPGYKFRVCRRLITNFHQPQSTLLLLVGAFVGESWKGIYQYALTHDFRFLSYGDSSLLEIDSMNFCVM